MDDFEKGMVLGVLIGLAGSMVAVLMWVVWGAALWRTVHGLMG